MDVLKKLIHLCFSVVLLYIPHICFASPYLGLAISPGFADFNIDTEVTNPFTNTKNNTHLAGSGLFATIVAGYDINYKKCYLAGEVSGSAGSLTSQTSNNDFLNQTFSSTKYRIQNNFDISLLPGYNILTSTLLYGRIGYANGNFKISTTNNSLINTNQQVTGFRYGLGLNQTFTEHLHGRIEYSRINYQNTSFIVHSGNTNISTTIAPSVNQIAFGLIYQF
ncbi:MAG TPA: outer membrane beta-barrel protein [Gammaproteobacteria bacterium]|nr:outer membrane beta-barrel protein [Gammaproteobacteria bacterium]